MQKVNVILHRQMTDVCYYVLNVFFVFIFFNVFTARRRVSAVIAMVLCLCPPSQVGVLSKRMNASSGFFGFLRPVLHGARSLNNDIFFRNFAGLGENLATTSRSCCQPTLHPLRSLVTSVLGHFGPFLRTELIEDRSD